jgi:hypothetical protein
MQVRFTAHSGHGEELAAVLLEAADGLAGVDACRLYLVSRSAKRRGGGLGDRGVDQPRRTRRLARAGKHARAHPASDRGAVPAPAGTEEDDQ